MEKIKAVIFDFDNTIVNSMEADIKSIKELMKLLPINVEFRIHGFISRKIDDILQPCKQ